MNLRFEPDSKSLYFELFHQGRGLEDPGSQPYPSLHPSIRLSIQHVCQAGTSSEEIAMNEPESLPWKRIQTSGREKNKSLNCGMKKKQRNEQS